MLEAWLRATGPYKRQHLVQSAALLYTSIPSAPHGSSSGFLQAQVSSLTHLCSLPGKFPIVFLRPCYKRWTHSSIGRVYCFEWTRSWFQSPGSHEGSMMVYICNHSPWEAEAQRLKAQCQPLLHSLFKDSLGSLSPCLKNEQTHEQTNKQTELCIHLLHFTS